MTEITDEQWVERLLPVAQNIEALRQSGTYLSPASAARLQDETGRVWTRPVADADLVDRCLGRGCPMYVSAFHGHLFDVARVPDELARRFWGHVRHLLVDENVRSQRRDGRTMQAYIWYDVPKVKRKKGEPPPEAVVHLDFGYC